MQWELGDQEPPLVEVLDLRTIQLDAVKLLLSRVFSVSGRVSSQKRRP